MPNAVAFLAKRVLRIVPAFLVATAFSAFIVGPLGSDPISYFSSFEWGQFTKSVITLDLPHVPAVFQGQPEPYVNGSLWTIAYEFRCYMLVAVWGAVGLLLNRAAWPLLTGVLLCCVAILPPAFTFPEIRGLTRVFGEAEKLFILSSMFATGGCFYILRGFVAYEWKNAVLASVAIVASGYLGSISVILTPILGGYILFWIAFLNSPFLRSFNRRADISYGIYLYGWPLQKLVTWFYPEASTWLVTAVALPAAALFGWASWLYIEKPSLELKGLLIRSSKDGIVVPPAFPRSARD